MGLLNGLFGADRNAGGVLADYAPLEWPHPREGVHLSAGERAANLAYFLSVKDTRVELVTGALADLGAEVPPPSQATEASGTSVMLHDLARSTLCKIKGFGKICAPGWRDRPVSGREARLLSFACDLGIYCGEAAVTTRDFAWTIDDTKYKPGKAMTTQGNVVIYKKVPFDPKPIDRFIDIIAYPVYTIHDEDRIRQGKGLAWVNGFSFLDDLTSGRHG